MARISAQEVRIPRSVREALARHEEVVIVNRERAAYVIVSQEDHARASASTRQGRGVREAVALLRNAALPDAGFGEDMEAVLRNVGPATSDPWAPS